MELSFNQIAQVAIGLMVLVAFIAVISGAAAKSEKGRARLRLGAMGLAIAGLLMIASGFLNGGDLSQISGGFMLIVFGTGVEVAKVGKPQGPE